ncbi:MAG: NAD(P)H-binding protein [Corynebacteriales bacterium]|nr:NAD(P)H-binding protein [Mycobacteriales bacterium]
MKTILVTGGTGTLGRQVTPLLLAAGHRVRVLSRKPHSSDQIEYLVGDALTNEGIDSAMAGAHTVIHLAGGPKGDDEATANVAKAARRAGVQHFVYISVIGANTLPLGYFKSKFGAEKAVRDSGVPWTILRAAQFHELTLTVLQKMAKLPVVPIPGGVRLQPVDSRDVAARLVELALNEPAGLVPDLAGPRVYELKELTRDYLKASRKHRLMMQIRMPGRAGRAYRSGENLSLDGATIGKVSWDAFLAEQIR